MWIESLHNWMDRATERRIRKLIPSIRSEDVRQINHEAYRRAKKTYYLRMVLLGGLVGGVFIGIIPRYYGPAWGVILGSLGFGAISFLLQRPFQRKYEREVLHVARELRYDVCVHCGYDLDNLGAVVLCPECGMDQTVESNASASNRSFTFEHALGRFSPWFIDSKLTLDVAQRQRIAGRAKTLFTQRPKSAAQIRRPMRLLHGLVLLLFLSTVVGFATATLVHWVVAMTFIMNAAALGLFILYYSQRRPFVLQALREQGDEPCTGCGYQMRCLPRDVIFCPECGMVRPCPVAGSPGYLHVNENSTL